MKFVSSKDIPRFICNRIHNWTHHWHTLHPRVCVTQLLTRSRGCASTRFPGTAAISHTPSWLIRNKKTQSFMISDHTEPLSSFRMYLFRSIQSPSFDTSTGFPRPFVPKLLRPAVFQSFHNLSHPGIRATQKLVTSRFVWPQINRDYRDWVRSCLHCQRAKIHRYTWSPTGTFPLPSSCFDHVHIDLVGPLPPACGFSYLLTCVDRFTRWPEAFPIRDMTSKTVARTFISRCVSRFGVPATTTTDRGRQFESAFFYPVHGHPW